MKRFHLSSCLHGFLQLFFLRVCLREDGELHDEDDSDQDGEIHEEEEPPTTVQLEAAVPVRLRVLRSSFDGLISSPVAVDDLPGGRFQQCGHSEISKHRLNKSGWEGQQDPSVNILRVSCEGSQVQFGNRDELRGPAVSLTADSLLNRIAVLPFAEGHPKFGNIFIGLPSS